MTIQQLDDLLARLQLQARAQAANSTTTERELLLLDAIEGLQDYRAALVAFTHPRGEPVR